MYSSVLHKTANPNRALRLTMSAAATQDGGVMLPTRNSQKKVFLAQQAIWDIDASGRESMPLACGYLKAFALADEDIRKEMDVRIFNFGGKDDTLSVIQRMLLHEVPDVLAISIFGWNYSMFGRVAETFRQLNPDGWVVFGGTHVANQAKRVFGH